MERNQAGSSWFAKAVVFSLAASLSGALLGAALGWLGSLISVDVRTAVATLGGMAAILVGISELTGHRIGLAQCDRETPQKWIHTGALPWALRNGVALGTGVFNRIGFWLWYAIPIGAFLSGSPLLGAVVYGAYSCTRGMAVWPIMYILGPRLGPDWADWLLRQKDVARLVTALLLLHLGIAALIIIGL